jgi:hypothetical protein
MSIAQPSRVRGSVLPVPGDNWAQLAQRHLPELEESEAVSKLQSWNLHVFMRSTTRPGQAANPILPSDVIFIEPPLARG